MDQNSNYASSYLTVLLQHSSEGADRASGQVGYITCYPPTMHLKGSQLQNVCLIVSAIVHLSNGDGNWFFFLYKAGLVEGP